MEQISYMTPYIEISGCMLAPCQMYDSFILCLYLHVLVIAASQEFGIQSGICIILCNIFIVRCTAIIDLNYELLKQN